MEGAAARPDGLMQKLDRIDKKLKYGDEDREKVKREIGHIKYENIDNYFTKARATEEKLLK